MASNDVVCSVLHSLSHPTRLRVVLALSRREMCVRELEDLLHVAQATLSQHLALLRRAGIVSGVREGQRVRYRLERPEVLEVIELLRRL